MRVITVITGGEIVRGEIERRGGDIAQGSCAGEKLDVRDAGGFFEKCDRFIVCQNPRPNTIQVLNKCNPPRARLVFRRCAVWQCHGRKPWRRPRNYKSEEFSLHYRLLPYDLDNSRILLMPELGVQPETYVAVSSPIF